MMYTVAVVGVVLGGLPFVLVRLGWMSARMAGVVGSPGPFLGAVAGAWLTGTYLPGAALVGAVVSLGLWWSYSLNGPVMEEMARREGRRR